MRFSTQIKDKTPEKTAREREKNFYYLLFFSCTKVLIKKIIYGDTEKGEKKATQKRKREC
jgi:hypothetical protein